MANLESGGVRVQDQPGFPHSLQRLRRPPGSKLVWLLVECVCWFVGRGRLNEFLVGSDVSMVVFAWLEVLLSC